MENCQSREGIVGSIRKTEFRYFFPIKVVNSRGQKWSCPFSFISVIINSKVISPLTISRCNK